MSFSGLNPEQYLELMPEVLYVLGALCLILVYVFARAIFRAYRFETLSRFRRRDYGFADLLNYAALCADGVIVNKNGSLMAAWSYRGPDNECVTAVDRNVLARRLNQFFAGFDTGWMINVDAIRTPVPQYFDPAFSHFKDRVSAGIDEERRRFFSQVGNMFDSMFVITFTYTPPTNTIKKVERFMFTREENETKDPGRKTQSLIDDFQKKCEEIEGGLRSILSNVERLKSFKREDEDGSVRTYDLFLSYLYLCVTGKSQLIYLPENPVYLDVVLGAGDFYTGVVPKMNDKFISVISIENLPAAVSPGILTILGELGCEYRWSTRYIYLDRNQAEAYAVKLRKKWEQKRRGFIQQLFNVPQTNINQDVENMINEANDVIAQISEGAVAYGFYTGVVVLMDEDREQLKRHSQMFMQNLARLGFGSRLEKIGCVDAWLGSFPGHGNENVLRPLISTMNFAALIPTSSPWIGEEFNPCPFYPDHSPPLMQCITGASLNTPFRLNLHEGDLGHTLVLGPTGAGKSTLLASLAVQARRYQNISVFAFDKGMSMFAVCKAVGGLHFTPAQGNDLCFCPLQYLDNKEDIAWASNWIQAILHLNDLPVSPAMVNEINDALLLMAGQHREDPDSDMSISNFWAIVQDEDVRAVLKSYMAGSPMGALFDAQQDGLTGFNDFNVFEIEALWELDEKYRLPVLLYLFRRIEKSLHGQPAMIFLDEAWTVLGHPVFREKIREWLKVLRKANCAVILATQSLTDAEKSGILDVLVESTRTKIFLPNAYAVQDAFIDLYKKFGLNYAQIRLIANGTPKRDYFIKGSSQSRMFRLALGPLMLAFVAVSSKDDVQMIKDLIARYGDGWVDQWLGLRGLQLPDNLRLEAA